MPRIQNPDWQRESYPYGYFYKQGITNDTSIINIPLQKGLYFMVEKAVIDYNAQNVNIAGAYAEPLKVFFVKNGMASVPLNSPVDIGLLASPADSGATVDTSPGANPAFPFKAVPLKRSKMLMLLCIPGDVLQVKISNPTIIGATPSNSLPSFVELFIVGRYYPDYDLPEWKRGTQCR